MLCQMPCVNWPNHECYCDDPPYVDTIWWWGGVCREFITVIALQGKNINRVKEKYCFCLQSKSDVFLSIGSQISSSFNNLDPFGTGQSLLPLQVSEQMSRTTLVPPLKTPPKWIRRPTGASFAVSKQHSLLDRTWWRWAGERTLWSDCPGTIAVPTRENSLRHFAQGSSCWIGECFTAIISDIFMRLPASNCIHFTLPASPPKRKVQKRACYC